MNTNKLGRDQHRQQINRADSFSNVGREALGNAVRVIQNVQGKSGGNASEQEVFAALMYEGLGKIDPYIQTRFTEKLRGKIKGVADFDSGNAVLRGTKRALKQLINENVLSKQAAKVLRKFALGKAQLDGDRTRLSGATTSALSSVVSNVASNKVASEAEHLKFKSNNRAEFLKKDKGITGVAPKSISRAEQLRREFELRSQSARLVKELLTGEARAYSEEERLNNILGFFLDENKALDDTYHQRARDVEQAIDNSERSETHTRKAFDEIKTYLQDVFSIELPELEPTQEQEVAAELHSI